MLKNLKKSDKKTSFFLQMGLLSEKTPNFVAEQFGSARPKRGRESGRSEEWH